MKPNQKDELEKKTDNEFVRKFAEEKYKYGFTTEVHTDIIERGLNEDVIRLISSKKDELSGDFLLCRSDEEERRTEKHGGSRS